MSKPAGPADISAAGGAQAPTHLQHTVGTTRLGLRVPGSGSAPRWPGKGQLPCREGSEVLGSEHSGGLGSRPLASRPTQVRYGSVPMGS